MALVSRDKRKAERMARKFKARAFYAAEEYAACLTNPEISAVYIATPPGEHMELTLQAAQAGKHVLCEKPLAASSQQSARMVEACQRHGVLLMTAYRKYFEPSCLYLKQLIQDGDLGRIDVVHTAFSEVFSPGVSPPWLVDATLAGGGPLMDLGVYCVNTSRWLLGEDPVEASARAWTNDAAMFRNVEEGISFCLYFPSGRIVQGCSTYAAALSSFLYIQGTKGWVCLSPAFPFDEERRLRGKIGGRWVERKFPVIDEFAPELDAFASAIQNKCTVQPDGAQGHRDVVICEAIYQAATRQERVVIGY